MNKLYYLIGFHCVNIILQKTSIAIAKDISISYIFKSITKDISWRGTLFLLEKESSGQFHQHFMCDFSYDSFACSFFVLTF